MFDQYLVALQLIAKPEIILSIAGGALGGLAIGAIPGLTSTMAIALLVPITFGMSAVHGLALVMGVYAGGISGGLVAACLLNIPGTPASASTCFDAFPLARKGQAVRALGLAVYASCVGGVVSGLALIIIAPSLAKVAMKFGPWEYFALVIFTFSCMSSLSKGSEIKAFIMAGLGVLTAMVGTDPVDAVLRFTFGIEDLFSGFSSLPALIGVFALPQLLKEVDLIGSKTEVMKVDFSLREFISVYKEIIAQKLNILRSSVIGVAIGILPGVGPGLSNVVAYAQAKSASKHPETFGTGEPAGIVSAETANNASMGGALIPLLTLGIPGDASTLMMLGVFMLHNIQPGPLLFRDNGDLVYSVFLSYFIAFAFVFIFYHFFIRYIIKMLVVPRQVMIPVLLVLCTIGCFALNNRMFDVYCFLAFGVLGYVLDHLNFPMLPLILGLILGSMAEVQFRLALSLSKGSGLPFLTRPICLALLVLSLLSLVLPYIAKYRKKRKAAVA